MGNSRPSSLIARLGKALSAPARLARLGLLKSLGRSLAAMPAAALAGVAIMFLVWSCERQTRQREAVEARQEEKHAAEEISRLEQQASGAVRNARTSAQAAQELEGRQQELAREAEGLRRSLESLRQLEFARSSEVATLPTSEVASRVASRLGEQGSGAGFQGSGLQDAQPPESRSLDPLTRLAPQQQAVNPLTRLALAGESASASHPLPQGGEGRSSVRGEGQKSLPALVLSEAGVRKVEATFLELDSCRQQAQVIGEQVSNCEQREKLASSIQARQSGTIVQLKAALADKDQALERSAEARRAEVKAARGTPRARVIRALGIFAGGLLAGVLLR